MIQPGGKEKESAYIQRIFGYIFGSAGDTFCHSPLTPPVTGYSTSWRLALNNMTINEICPGLAMIFRAANSGPVKTRANGSWTIYTYRAL
jgi:hypothetical protein